MIRSCGSNIASDCKAGVNEHPSGTLGSFTSLQFRQVGVRGLCSATDAISLPKPKPRAVREHFVVPTIGSRDVACAEWPNIRRFEHFL